MFCSQMNRILNSDFGNKKPNLDYIQKKVRQSMQNWEDKQKKWKSKEKQMLSMTNPIIVRCVCNPPMKLE